MNGDPKMGCSVTRVPCHSCTNQAKEAMMSSIVVKDKVPSYEVKHGLPILALSIAALSQALG